MQLLAASPLDILPDENLMCLTSCFTNRDEAHGLVYLLSIIFRRHGDTILLDSLKKVYERLPRVAQFQRYVKALEKPTATNVHGRVLRLGHVTDAEEKTLYVTYNLDQTAIRHTRATYPAKAPKYTQQFAWLNKDAVSDARR